MDPTERKITKIAREAGKFTVQAMKEMCGNKICTRRNGAKHEKYKKPDLI